MATSGEFRVAVTKEDLVFAAAHFITLAGHRCEALHGHNYRVGVTLEGALDGASWFVVDFAAVKAIMRRLTAELDHHVILPRDNPKLVVTTESGSVRVAYDGEARYVFPVKDCVVLPIPNTTVEMLAQYLTGRLRRELASVGAARLRAIELEVEENFGQSAIYRETLD